MRLALLVMSLALAGCAAGGGPVNSRSLTAADASTALITGERIDALTRANTPSNGQDPLITLSLRHADGRTMTFQQNNHTADDLMAQRPGGALAQIMGLFGEEAPALYSATTEGASGAPFFCGPEGPAGLGVYEGADGVTQMVGLKQALSYETRPDGVVEVLPYSPDMVCARLKFRAG